MQKGHKKLCIRTVDTDVVVLAIAVLSQDNPYELWLAFGNHISGTCRFTKFVSGLDPVVCKTLPVFYAFFWM